MSEHILVVNGLKQKRAELSGELLAAERAVARIRTDLAGVDAVIRIFDPEAKPTTIKPRIKRGQSSRFRPGEMMRAVWTVLRKAEAPLTVREIAERVAEATGLDMSTTKAAGQVVANVRAALARPHEGLRCEKNGKEHMRYRVT
jgi:hypothetical protein